MHGFPGHGLRAHRQGVVEADELRRALGKGHAMALNRGVVPAGDRPGEGGWAALRPVRRRAQDERCEQFLAFSTPFRASNSTADSSSATSRLEAIAPAAW